MAPFSSAVSFTVLKVFSCWEPLSVPLWRYSSFLGSKIAAAYSVGNAYYIFGDDQLHGLRQHGVIQYDNTTHATVARSALLK